MLFTLLNYVGGNLDPVYEMLNHPRTVLGLGDGGAHCGIVCDATMTTFTLTHWVRDRRRGPRLPLEFAVRRLTADNAALFGFHDRGLVRPGLKADLNVIDLDRLRLHRPEVAFDLPAGGRRLLQRADGYVATHRRGRDRHARRNADRSPPGPRGPLGARVDSRMMPSATGAPAKFDFPVLDGDGHVAEPHDLWAALLRRRASRRGAGGAARSPICRRAAPALMLEGRCLVRGIEAVTFAGQNPRAFRGRRWDEGYPGAFDPAHRLRDMDLEGIDRAMVFPSLAGALGGVRDPQLAAAMARAYNRWILDYCSTDPKRLMPAAVVPLQDPPAAVAEVEWAARHGFRCVMVRACRYQGRAHDHPDFAGFYAACAHHDVVVGPAPVSLPRRRVEPGDPAGPGRRCRRATSSWPTCSRCRSTTC